MRFGLAALLLLLCACAPRDAVEAEPSPRTTDPHGELACDESTRAGIDETIDGQLVAFARGDYEAALGYASEGFRSSTNAEQFRAIIETDYPVLRDASGHRSGTCVVRGDAAELLVTIEGNGGETDELVYRMAREDGEWRIVAAGRVPEQATEEPVPV